MMPRGGNGYLIPPLLRPSLVMARVGIDLLAPADADILDGTRIVVGTTFLPRFLRGSSSATAFPIGMRRPFFFSLLRLHETTVCPIVVIVVTPAAGSWR